MEEMFRRCPEIPDKVEERGSSPFSTSLYVYSFNII